MALHTWTCQGCGAVVTMESEPWQEGCVEGPHDWRWVGAAEIPGSHRSTAPDSDRTQFHGFLFWVSLFPLLLVTDVVGSSVLKWCGLAADRAESYAIATALGLCAVLVLWRYRARRRAELESLFGPISVRPRRRR